MLHALECRIYVIKCSYVIAPEMSYAFVGHLQIEKQQEELKFIFNQAHRFDVDDVERWEQTDRLLTEDQITELENARQRTSRSCSQLSPFRGCAL